MMATGRAASWSPLSENGVDVLAAALNGSALGALMIGWTSRLNLGGFTPFRREGFNRARVARLRWHAGADKPSSIEVIAEAKLPETYSDVGTHLMFMIGARFRINLVSDEKRPWLDVPDLYELLQAVLLTLTQPEVVQALADLAGIDPVLVLPPRSANLVTGVDISELLNLRGLTRVPGAGSSRGARLLASPELDVRNTEELHRQVDAWLLQFALDAGLHGMEKVLLQLHATGSGTRV